MNKNNRLLAILLCLQLNVAYAQRNVVLIIADDLGTDYFGFYPDHQDTVDVPNIRRLAGRGVRFTNAWANPVCSATRAGILTGRYSFRTGVGGIVGGAGGSGALDVDEMTIPRMLELYQPGGIAKANLGKWHLQQPSPMALQNPLVMGYDHFAGIFIGALPDYFSWNKITNGVTAPVTTYATTETTNDAIAFVTAQLPKPFFLWLGYNAPHTPLHLPPAGLHTFTALPGTQPHINQNPKLYFQAMIQALDTELGRLFDSLEVHGRLDSTDIIFIGDNGNTAQTAQIADIDRAKGTIYNYGVHVPFIIAGPSVTEPGRSSDALVNTVDLFATIVELFGYADWAAAIAPDEPVDSRSLVPILKNQATAARPWAFTEIFKNTPDADDGKTMRNTTYKLLRFDTGTEEFYDLAADPGETDNLLDGPLNADQLLNYNYLCGEMTALLGSGTFCTPSVAAPVPAADAPVFVSPNPFDNRIVLHHAENDVVSTLVNALGQVVFSGREIAAHDFSDLPAGIYFLQIADRARSCRMLVKSN